MAQGPNLDTSLEPGREGHVAARSYLQEKSSGVRCGMKVRQTRPPRSFRRTPLFGRHSLQRRRRACSRQPPTRPPKTPRRTLQLLTSSRRMLPSRKTVRARLQQQTRTACCASALRSRTLHPPPAGSGPRIESATRCQTDPHLSSRPDERCRRHAGCPQTIDLSSSSRSTTFPFDNVRMPSQRLIKGGVVLLGRTSQRKPGVPLRLHGLNSYDDPSLVLTALQPSWASLNLCCLV